MDFRVIGPRPVSGVNHYFSPEVIPDALEDIHQPEINQNFVGPVLTGEFLHLKVG